MHHVRCRVCRWEGRAKLLAINGRQTYPFCPRCQVEALSRTD
jgi:phage FluMu protein Com